MAVVGADVLDEDGQRLQHLLGDVPLPVAPLLQELGEVVQQVVLCKVVEVARVVLVSPYHELCNGPEGLHHDLAVAICDDCILLEHIVQVLELLQRETGTLGAVDAKQVLPEAPLPSRHRVLLFWCPSGHCECYINPDPMPQAVHVHIAWSSSTLSTPALKGATIMGWATFVEASACNL